MSDVKQRLIDLLASDDADELVIDDYCTVVDALREILKMREALEFYADVSKYPAPYTGNWGELWNDCGETARKALGR